LTTVVYLDTSALLKRYVPEANSEGFDAYFIAQAPASISRLGLVEIRCALARKRRNRSISAEREKAAMDEVRTDIQDGVLVVHPTGDTHFAEALHLIDQVGEVPLRSLDALHLSIARSLNARELATADMAMRQAAQVLGMSVAYFGD
jgi:predicted nucleic acid-binding protein